MTDIAQTAGGIIPESSNIRFQIQEKIRRSTPKWKAPGRLEDHDDRQKQKSSPTRPRVPSLPPRAPTRPSRTPSGSTQPPMPQKPPRTPQPTPRPTPPPIAPIPPPADMGQQWLSNEQGYATSLSKFDDNSNFQPPPETAQVMSRNDKYHFSQRAPDPEDSSLKSLKGIANSFSKVDNIVMSTSAKDNDNILDVEAQTYAHVDDQIEGKLAKRLQLPKKTEQIMKRHEGKHFEVNTRYQGIQEMEYNQSMGQDTFVIESKTVGLHGEDQKEDKEYNCKDWAKCAQDKDVNAAFKLLDNDILPDHKDLQLANDNFIDDSEGKELLKNICQKIENRLMETNECIENVKGCLKCDDPMRKIIFVMQTRSESPKIDCQYTFHVKQQHNEQVNEEMKIEKLTGKEFKNRFYKANECLRINSPGLMDSHGNLTGTSLSTVKLRTGQDPEPTTCIVFYVEAKGYVPVGEDLLPSHLEYDTDMVFKTDVRESQCAIATAGPSDKHEELKIGCRIESLKVPDGGTLGGFIDHPEHGLCAITCSHVLFTADEFEKMYRRQIHVKYMAKTMCYQPKNPDICGEVCDV